MTSLTVVLFIFLGFTVSTSSVKRKPRAKLQKQQAMTVEEILKQPGTQTIYVPTNFGAMKVQFNDYLFIHHYTRNCVARYRCTNFDKSKCPASIVIKEKLTYPCHAVHNH